MKTKDYVQYTSLILTFACLLHLLRVINNWGLALGPWEIPMWLSVVVVVFAGYLVVCSKHLKK